MDALHAHDQEPSRLDRLIDDQQQRIVRECLAELTDDYRTVLTLRMEGLKYADIAARLGVNENTVATWVRRGTRAAIGRIRARLDGGVSPSGAVRAHERPGASWRSRSTIASTATSHGFLLPTISANSPQPRLP